MLRQLHDIRQGRVNSDDPPRVSTRVEMHYVRKSGIEHLFICAL